MPSDQIGYEYFDSKDEGPQSMEMAFSRPLRAVVPRIELLGFRLEAVRQAYEVHTKQWIEDQAAIDDEDPPNRIEALSFNEFVSFVQAHAIQDLDDSFVDEVGEACEIKVRGRFDDQVIARVPIDADYQSSAYSERCFFGTLINFLHPYAVLRVLAENPANLEAEVIWQYGPLVEAGYATITEFIPSARRNETFLIATEGTSDIHILTHAIRLLRPDIADFYRFIDASERHPFSGSGSLVKFAEGLAKIDVHNQIVFLFDNDAEGFDAFEAVQRFKLPQNMRALVLPALDDFRQFPARGPTGVVNSDINGRAAAIECYLDLDLKGYGPANVVWTNYKKERNVYQGALDFKESYVRAFLEQTVDTIRDGGYDVRKLECVLSALVDECSGLAMAVRTLNNGWNRWN